MNVDIFSLIIRKLHPKDMRTFSSLKLVCKTAWKAYVAYMKNLLKEYKEQRFYVYWKTLDGWGGTYQGEYRISNTRPTQQEIDPLENSHLVFLFTREELNRKRSFVSL